MTDMTPERLRKFIEAYSKYADDHQLDEFGEYRQLLVFLRELESLRAEAERLRSVADAEMKLREGNFARIESLEAELAGVRGALIGVMPLLAECDCIYSNGEDSRCACRNARAALAASDDPASAGREGK